LKIDAILESVSFLIKAFDLPIKAGNDDFQKSPLLAMKAFRKHCQAQELFFNINPCKTA